MAECKLRPHGTKAAYRRHSRAQETPCESCLEWSRQDSRARYATSKRKARSPKPARIVACKTCGAQFSTTTAKVYCQPTCRPGSPPSTNTVVWKPAFVRATDRAGHYRDIKCVQVSDTGFMAICPRCGRVLACDTADQRHCYYSDPRIAQSVGQPPCTVTLVDFD